jgi:type II secretory pathway predicted ATPase ExeA
MFESFYGFTATPFSRDISVDALYKDDERNELIERLKYAAKRQLFAVLTGESGSGKTTLLRRFTDEITGSGHMVIYLSDSKLTPRPFYKGILEQLGFEAKYFRGDAKSQLHKEVELLRILNNLSLVLIVDEAHLLARDMLEEVRFLLNLKMDSQSPLALILAGQVELWEKLRLQSYAAIRQRIDILCQLSKLDLAKSMAYIDAHFAYAGFSKEVFSDSAYEEIFKFSSGIPRMINKVCTAALLYGAQNSKNIIDSNMLKFVIDSELA